MTGDLGVNGADRRRLVAVVALSVAAVAAALVLGATGLYAALADRGDFVSAPAVADAPADPAAGLPLFVDPGSQSARVAATDPRFAALASVPQAKWFTDWTDPATIEEAMSTYVGAAAAMHRMPVAVLYRIPHRDCGGHAAGGAATAAEYRAWIDGAARGIAGRPAMVVVEPDAVGQMGRCAGRTRAALLRYAVARMAASGAWVYLDAGHSDWWPPAEMARRLDLAGIEAARGFATNVANYHPEARELDYAQALAAALAARGIAGKTYVVDTGRSGGTVGRGQRCNPPGARLGSRPAVVLDGALDARLWVKAPAESDGRCHGGPGSGFYDQLALMLLGRPNNIERE